MFRFSSLLLAVSFLTMLKPAEVAKTVPLVVITADATGYCSAAPIARHIYLTAGHCIEDDATFEVGGHTAVLAKLDKEHDLAELVCPDCNGKPFRVSNVEPVEGDWVVAYGWAHGERMVSAGGAVTATRLEQVICEAGGENCDVVTAMRWNGHLIPGMSGGPTLNDRNEIVGVNQAAGRNDGDSLSVPLLEIRQFLDVNR